MCGCIATSDVSMSSPFPAVTSDICVNTLHSPHTFLLLLPHISYADMCCLQSYCRNEVFGLHSPRCWKLKLVSLFKFPNCWDHCIECISGLNNLQSNESQAINIFITGFGVGHFSVTLGTLNIQVFVVRVSIVQTLVSGGGTDHLQGTKWRICKQISLNLYLRRGTF